MDTTALADCSDTELAVALNRVAANPGQTQHLHEILGAYCHQSRNLLNCMNMSLYLARRSAAAEGLSFWSDVESRYRNVERFLDRIQLICRPMPLNLVRLSLSLLFEDREGAWTEQLAGAGRRLILEPPSAPAVGAFDPIRLGLGFDDLVDWRLRVGPSGSDLRIRWKAEDGQFHVDWEELDCRPSTERSAPIREPPIADFETLTVPLLTRIVTLHGGRLAVSSSDRWRIDLRWPLDADTTQGEAPRC